MTRTLRLKDLESAAANASEQPFFTTGSSGRNGVRPGPPPLSKWLSHSQLSRAPNPILRFTDLVNGPSSGLGDGVGSGAIVTIWAQGVGNEQGDGQVFFTDLMGTKRPAAHVYYWKRADGEGPSGPARIWFSHLMQEIAFSIPSGSAVGPGQITVEKDGKISNELPFTVRSGNIYHFKSTGSDAGDGSFNDPWLNPNTATHSQANGQLAPAGSVLYLHDVNVGSFSDVPVRGIYWNNSSASGDYDNHFSIVSYPGFMPTVVAQRGFEVYLTEGQLVSKINIYSSDFLQKDELGQPVGGRINEAPGTTFGIQTSKYGRTIGNRVQDIPGGMSNKWNGAISGGGDKVGGNRIYGNEVYNHGDHGTSKFHHTTYLSVRSGQVVDAWAWEFNFLHDNRAKAGIHQYDQNEDNGDILGTLVIRNNVICEQGGGGISVGASADASWTNNGLIENNVIIEAGLAAAWDGIDPGTADSAENGSIMFRDGSGADAGLLGTYTVRNNLAYNWSSDGTGFDQGGAPRYGGLTLFRECAAVELNYDYNINLSNNDWSFFWFDADVDTSKVFQSAIKNTWYYSGASPQNAIAPTWDSEQSIDDPLIELDGAIVTISPSSPLIGNGYDNGYDIYGVPRSSLTKGPVEVII